MIALVTQQTGNALIFSLTLAFPSTNALVFSFILSSPSTFPLPNTNHFEKHHTNTHHHILAVYEPSTVSCNHNMSYENQLSYFSIDPKKMSFDLNYVSTFCPFNLYKQSLILNSYSFPWILLWLYKMLESVRRK